MNNHLKIKEEVATALKNKQPVVALESTIISHGFSYPENLETARECERIIREQGATPATIGIRNGKILIGMDDSDLEFFATNKTILKASRKDVAQLIAMKKDGATTVATTMMFAAMANIKMFATGGIGGVHVHGENTMDISADLIELSQTNVNVVCSGAKSILDLAKTKEVLETFGVPIIGYQSDKFPDFYTRDSGLGVDFKADSADEVATIIKTKDELNLSSGVLITNPILEKFEMESIYINNKIQEAIEASIKESIKGKYVTPYLLAYLHKNTEGKTVLANKALVFNNALVAAKIAVALSK